MAETNQESWPRVAATKQILMCPGDGENPQYDLSFVRDQLTIGDYRAIGNRRTFTVRRPVEIFMARYADGRVFVAEFLERPSISRLTIRTRKIRGMMKIIADNGRLQLVGINQDTPGAHIAFLTRRKILLGDMKQQSAISPAIYAVVIEVERLWGEAGEAYRVLALSFSEHANHSTHDRRNTALEEAMAHSQI